MADKDVHVNITVDSDTRGAAKAAKAVEDVRKQSDRLEAQFRDTAKAAAGLDAELKDLYDRRHDQVVKLGQADDAELLKEHNRTNRRIALLEKLKKELAGGASGSAGSVLDMGGEGIRPRNAAIGGLVAAGVMTSPAWGALLAGALSGTVVGAAMAGGILSAIKDPAVGAAAMTFGQSISHEFFSGGDAFRGPIVESLGILQKDFQDLNLGDAFAKTAPHLATLAHGIGDLAKNLMPGFNKLLERAGPYTEVFADGLAGLGTALGTFMDDISSSPGALEGLQAGFMVLNGTIIVLGRTLHGLSEIFEWGVQKNAEWTGWLEDFMPGTGWGQMNDTLENIAGTGDKLETGLWKVKRGTEEAGTAASTFAGYLNEARHNAQELEDALFNLFDMEMSASKAADDYEEAIDNLTDSVKENGKTLDIHTEKGRENRDKLRDLVQAAMDQREANIKAGMSVQEANEKYADQIAFIEKLAEKLGFAKKKIDELVGTYEVKVITTYITHGNKPNYNPGSSSAASQEVYGAPGRASGGSVMAGMPYMINERGRETVTFGANGTVHPANLTPVGGGGYRVASIVVTDSLMSSALEMIRTQVRAEGGDVVAFWGPR